MPLGFSLVRYSESWYWSSGSVAYYRDLKFQYDKELCGHLERRNKQSPPYKLAAKRCKSRRYTSALCELSTLSDLQHLSQPVKLPTLLTGTKLRDFLVTCPRQHVTYDMFFCDKASVCRRMSDTEEWYGVSCDMSQGPSQPSFYCGVRGEFVPYSLVCDFRKDCANGIDEHFCVHRACEDRMMNCGQGQCVDITKRCDGYKDCLTDLDEEGCPEKRFIYRSIHPPAVINFDMSGGITMTPLPQNTTKCPATHFQCHHDGYCLPVYVRCNDNCFLANVLPHLRTSPPVMTC
ncbi:hypothetical protein ACOMHN_016527 [Nucella lapillus]